MYLWYTHVYIGTYGMKRTLTVRVFCVQNPLKKTNLADAL